MTKAYDNSLLARNINVSGVNTTVSGLLTATSGNFTQSLQVNGSGVSINGHNHTSSNIADFNSSVSGLLPTIANSGDNRILTSTGSTVGINAESSLTFNGSLLTAPSGSFTNSLVIGSNNLTPTDALNIINSTNLYLWSTFR